MKYRPVILLLFTLFTFEGCGSTLYRLKYVDYYTSLGSINYQITQRPKINKGQLLVIISFLEKRYGKHEFKDLSNRARIEVLNENKDAMEIGSLLSRFIQSITAIHLEVLQIKHSFTI